MRAIIRFCVPVLYAVLAFSQFALCQQPITLENSELRIRISPGNAGLLEVWHKRTNASYLGSARQPGWFRIQVPLPHWDGHAAGSWDLKAFSVQKRTSDSVELHASQLVSNEGSFAILTKLTLRLEADNLVCRLSLQNRTGKTIDRIVFPMLGVPAASDAKETLVMPHMDVPLRGVFSENAVRIGHSPFDTLDPRDSWFFADPKISARAFNYPDTLPTAWTIFSADGKGIGLDIHDRQVQFQKFVIERRLYRDASSREANRRDYELSWNWYPLVGPGASWESPEVYIKFDEGDWHEIAFQHRMWLKKWIRRPDLAQKLQSSIGWISRGVGSYDEIPAIAQQGVEVGAPYFIVYHWGECGPAGMVYGAYPRADLGGLEALRRNLKKARELGSYPLAWLNSTLTGDGTRDHLIRGRKWMAIDRWGAGILGGQWSMGPANVPWLEFDPTGEKDLVVDTIRRLINDYHFSGFEMDQAYKYYLSYRDPSQNPPELAFSTGYHDLYTRAIDIVKKADPNGIIVGEGLSDWLDQYVDSSWIFDGGALDALRLSRLRYSMPWVTIPVKAVVRDRGHANRAFMLNAPLDIFDDLTAHSEYANHLRLMHGLKKSISQYLYRGEFSDGEGFSLQGGAQVLARSYKDPAGKFLAVVVVNASSMQAESTLKGVGDFASRPCVHHYLDGRTEHRPVASEIRLELPPFDVQVLVFDGK